MQANMPSRLGQGRLNWLQRVSQTPNASACRWRIQGAHSYHIQFHGDSWTYSLLWWRSALLTVLTLGFYLPNARVAVLGYLARSTEIAGLRFAFHGDANRMRRPTMIFGAFLLLYAVASYLDPIAGLLAALFFALLWPAIWRASTAFRLAQTSLGADGPRVRYVGSTEDAYLHVGLPLVLFVFPAAWFGADRSMFEFNSTTTWLCAMGLLMWVALWPVIAWQLKRHLHGSLSLGPVQTQLKLSPQTVMLAYTPIYVAVATLLASAFVLSGVFNVKLFKAIGHGTIADMVYYEMTAAMWLWLGAVAATWLLVLRPMAIATQQRLVWHRTLDSAHGLRMRVQLPPGQAMRVQAFNMAMVLISFGLYWPCARLAMLRLRLESTWLESARPLDDVLLLAQANADTGTEFSPDASTAEIGL